MPLGLALSFITLPGVALDPDGNDRSGVRYTEADLSVTVIEKYKWTLTSSLNGTIPLFGFPGVFAVVGTGGDGISSSLNIAILIHCTGLVSSRGLGQVSIFISEDG